MAKIPGLTVTSPMSDPLVKKSKSKKEDEVALSDTKIQPENSMKRKRKQGTIDVKEVDGEDLNPSKEKKSKKRKREAAAMEASATGGAGKKDKKRRKSSQDRIQAVSDNELDNATKKKRKNKTGFLDPDEDSTLPEQSQKSLAYAFSQFHRPKKWKFKKARQNWLIRNIWSKEAIPDAHLPVVMEYLTKVQGGVRENLIISCRAALEPAKEAESPAVTQPEQSTTTPVSTAPQPDKTKISRAQELLKLLSAPDLSLA